MKLRKGHFTGFFATVVVFGIIFLYIYINTMEIGKLYNIKETSKVKLGRNIYTAIFNDNEDYIAYINYSGVLKLAKTETPKDILYTQKEINSVFFYKDLLVLTDKTGKAYSYNIKDGSITNYTLECFNKYVFVIEGNICALEPSSIIKVSLIGDENRKEYKINALYNSFEDIYKGEDYISVFTKDCAYIYEYPDFKEKKVDLKDYASKGIMSKNQIGERLVVYLNSKGETVIKNGNHYKTLTDLPKPHSIYLSEKLGLILVADNKKAICYDELGEKEWEKDMLSDSMVMSNKGEMFIDIHKKSQAAAYDILSGAEKFSLDILQKATFSQSDNLIFGIEKSAY